MVAALLSLRAKLMQAELVRSKSVMVGFVLTSGLALVTVLLSISLVWSLGGLASHYEALTGGVIVVIGSAVFIAWTAYPILSFSPGTGLNPRHFVTFPIAGWQMASALVFGSLLTVPGSSTLALGIVSGLLWRSNPVAMLAGFVGALLAFLLAQIGCGLTGTALARALSSRKARDLSLAAASLGALVLLIVGVGGSLVTNYARTHLAGLPGLAHALLRVSSVIAWTPLGAPWALGGDAVQGSWGRFGAHLALTLGYLLVGSVLLAMLLHRQLNSPKSQSRPGRRIRGNLIAAMTAAPMLRQGWMPVIVVSARCLAYWRRDSRYGVRVVTLVLTPLVFLVMGQLMNAMISNAAAPGLPPGSGSWLAIVGLCFAALVIGFSLSSDVASDATAWWMHPASGVKGWQDRLGRVFGQAIWALPALVATSIAFSLLGHHAADMLRIIALVVALYGSGLAVASVCSAALILPTYLPGQSSLDARAGLTGLASLAQMGCLLAALALAGPPGAMLLLLPQWATAAAVSASFCWALLVIVAGVACGGVIMDRQALRIMALLISNDSRNRSL